MPSGRTRIDLTLSEPLESGRATSASAPVADDALTATIAQLQTAANECETLARSYEATVTDLRPVLWKVLPSEKMWLAQKISTFSEIARGLRAQAANLRRSEWEIFRSSIQQFDVLDAGMRECLQRAFEGLPAEYRRLAPSRVAGITDWQANAVPRTHGTAIPDDSGRYWITLNLQTLARVSEYERVRACAHELIHVLRGHRSRNAAVKEIHEDEACALVDLWFPSQ